MKRIRRITLGIVLAISLVAPFTAQAASSKCYWWNRYLCSTYYIVTPNNLVGPNSVVGPNS